MDKKIYKVVVPIVNRDFALMLLKSIAANTIIPDKVLIIDNSMDKSLFTISTNFPVEIFIPGKIRLGVNKSLNLGISKIGDCDYLALLNDDVILGKYFFEKNINTFQNFTDCGAVCPNTISDLKEFRRKEKMDKAESITLMQRREGWAVSFVMDLLKKIPPIPKELITFCGDDWFWRQTYLRGLYWYKDSSNIIYHEGGVSVRKLGARKYLRQDKDIMEKFKQKLKNEVF